MQVVFKGNKFIDGRDGGSYYSGEYVDWLETQFKESRREVHSMAAERNKWKGIAAGLLEDLGDLEVDE